MVDAISKTQQADHDTLIRVETQLKSLTDEIRSSNTNVTQVIADHEARIRALENAAEIIKGTSAGVTNNRRTLIEIIMTVAAAITAYATYLLGRH